MLNTTLETYLKERWQTLPQRNKNLLCLDDNEEFLFLEILWRKQYYQAIAEHAYSKIN